MAIVDGFLVQNTLKHLLEFGNVTPYLAWILHIEGPITTSIYIYWNTMSHCTSCDCNLSSNTLKIYVLSDLINDMCKILISSLYKPRTTWHLIFCFKICNCYNS